MTASAKKTNFADVDSTEDDVVIMGSGDFLVDQGYEDPEEFRVKAHLCGEIENAIADRNLNQAEAASLLGLSQPDVSRIVNGRFDDYSVWRLMKALSCFGHDIVISVGPALEEKGVIFSQNMEVEVSDASLSLGMG